MFYIRTEDPKQDDVVDVLRNGEAYAADLYPAESNHFFTVDELRADNVRFFVARNDASEVVGTVAVSLHEDWAELKRMWVEPAARGQGLARQLLSRAEIEALEVGTSTLRLETGIHNLEALKLYRKAGFVERGPFGEYRLDPLSVFMEKRLSSDLWLGQQIRPT